MIVMFNSDPNLKRLKKSQKAKERTNKEMEEDKKNTQPSFEEPPPLMKYTLKQTWQRKSHG